MSYTDFDFPHTHMYESDLREVLATVRKLEEIVKNFVNTEKIVFADPITWDITEQYTKGTIVLNSEGNAYLSKEPVPKGIQLNNEDYWLEIFNFTDYTRTANKNLTVNIETNTTRATAAYQVDDWLIWYDVLYKVTSAIAIDDPFIIAPQTGANIIHFTVEEFIKAFITYATGLINQYKDDIDASELLYKQQLAQDIADTTATLTARLNAAISGVTVDSEVIDARVGYDSTAYPTLGDAIRSQITDLHTLVSDVMHLDATNATSMLSGDDLNNYTTPGNFKCTGSVAATLIHKPNFNTAFRLIVLTTTAANRVWQIAMGNSNTPPFAIRAQYNNAGDWGDWLLLSDKTDINNLKNALDAFIFDINEYIYKYINTCDDLEPLLYINKSFTVTVSSLISNVITLDNSTVSIEPFTKFYLSYNLQGDFFTTNRLRLYLIGYDSSNNIVQRLQLNKNNQEYYFTAANIDHFEVDVAFMPNERINVPYDITFNARVILLKYKEMLDKKGVKVLNETPVAALRNQLPSYFVDDGTQLYTDDKCDFINSRYNGDRVAITFVTDVHWKNNQKHSSDLIGYVNNKCDVDLTVMGGDILNNASDASSTAENIYQLNQYLKTLQANVPDKMLFVVGNHDNGLANGTSLTPAEQAARIVNFENLYKTCIFPWSDIYNFTDSGNYTRLSELWYWERMHYYYDDVENMIRCIVINTGNPENPATVGSVSYGRYEIYYQLNWLYNTLMNTPDGYSVIVFGHYFFGNTKGSITQPARNIARMLVAAKTHSVAYTTSEAQAYGVAASFDFSNVPNIDIIGTICGHSHYDASIVFKGVDGNDSYDLGTDVTASDEILMICTGNDSATVRDEDIPATIGTISEQLFDVFLITKQAGRIYSVRFGAGNNRSMIYRA